MILSDRIIFLLLWLIFLAGIAIIDRFTSDTQTQNEPEADPCDTCLRWSECHAVDAEICPHIQKGGRPDA